MRHEPMTIASIDLLSWPMQERALKMKRAALKMLNDGWDLESVAADIVVQFPKTLSGSIDLGYAVRDENKRRVPVYEDGTLTSLAAYDAVQHRIIVNPLRLAEEAKRGRIPLRNIIKSALYHEASHARSYYMIPRYRHALNIELPPMTLLDMLKAISVGRSPPKTGLEAASADIRDFLIERTNVRMVEGREGPIPAPEIFHLHGDKDYFERRARKVMKRLLSDERAIEIANKYNLTRDELKSAFLFYYTHGDAPSAVFGVGETASRYWQEQVLPERGEDASASDLASDAAAVGLLNLVVAKAGNLLTLGECPRDEVEGYDCFVRKMRTLRAYRDLERRFSPAQMRLFYRTMLAKVRGSEQYVRLRDEIRAFSQQAVLDAFMALDAGVCGPKERLYLLEGGTTACIERVLRKRSPAYQQLSRGLTADEMKKVTSNIGKAIARHYLNRTDLLALREPGTIANTERRRLARRKAELDLERAGLSHGSGGSKAALEISRPPSRKKART